jgi:hypothetical protein
MWVTSPLVPKSRSSCAAGLRLPLPDTVDWTTPRLTVTVRVEAVDVFGVPMTMIAMATAAAVSAASASVVVAGLCVRLRSISRWNSTK